MDKQEWLHFFQTGDNGGEISCGFWKHFGADEQQGEKAIEAHIRYYQETGVPLVKVMNEHYFQLQTPVRTPEDWAQIPEMDLYEIGYGAYLEEIRQIRERLGKEAFILATIHGILVSACHATEGVGRFPDPNNLVTCHLKEKPEAVARGLEKIGQTLEQLCLACLEAGADGIYYALLGAEEHRFSEELFSRYVKPAEIRLLEHVKEKGIVFLHICKDSPRLPMLRDYPAHVVNWAVNDGNYSLSDGAELFPDKIIMGGFDNRQGILFTGTEEELAAEMERMADVVGRRRILIGADCTIPASMPSAQIRRAVEACRKVSEKGSEKLGGRQK